jgi:hypothetical protein
MKQIHLREDAEHASHLLFAELQVVGHLGGAEAEVWNRGQAAQPEAKKRVRAKKKQKRASGLTKNATYL